MNRATRLRALGLAVVLMGLLASPASASTGYGFHFKLPKTDGYGIEIEGEDATAFIKVSAFHLFRSFVSTTYVARAKVGARNISADFAPLGRIRLHFDPSGPLRRCVGPDDVTSHTGLFRGQIDFTGEDGYIAFHTHRVKGTATSPPSGPCPNPEPKPTPHRRHHKGKHQSKEDEVKSTTLLARSRSGSLARAFEASTERKRSVAYFGFTSQALESIGVSRAVLVLASPFTFTSNLALSFARVEPPPPFSGTGTLQRNPNGRRSWTGSLAVSFPGAPNMPLTGPEFRTRLARSW